jgi:putative hydrolase of the HAD superfamily
LKLEYSNYNHLSFDLWLTLIKSNPKFKSKRNQLFKDYFEIEDSIEKVNDIVRYYDVLCNNTNEKTGLNIDTFEIYYLILNALNVKINDIETKQLDLFYKETEFLFMEYKPELIHPKTDMLFEEIISQNKTINVLSNTGFIQGHTLRKLIAYYGLDEYFKFQIYSDEVGFSKPNLKIFQLVHEEINRFKKTPKNEVIHIGDNQVADYNGAISFGFDAFLLKI